MKIDKVYGSVQNRHRSMLYCGNQRPQVCLVWMGVGPRNYLLSFDKIVLFRAYIELFYAKITAFARYYSESEKILPSGVHLAHHASTGNKYGSFLNFRSLQYIPINEQGGFFYLVLFIWSWALLLRQSKVVFLTAKQNVELITKKTIGKESE